MNTAENFNHEDIIWNNSFPTRQFVCNENIVTRVFVVKYCSDSTLTYFNKYNISSELVTSTCQRRHYTGPARVFWKGPHNANFEQGPAHLVAGSEQILHNMIRWTIKQHGYRMGFQVHIMKHLVTLSECIESLSHK